MNKNDLDNYITGHYGEVQFDEAWEKFHALIDDETFDNAMTAEDAVLAWSMGLKAWKKAAKKRTQH